MKATCWSRSCHARRVNLTSNAILRVQVAEHFLDGMRSAGVDIPQSFFDRRQRRLKLLGRVEAHHAAVHLIGHEYEVGTLQESLSLLKGLFLFSREFEFNHGDTYQIGE